MQPNKNLIISAQILITRRRKTPVIMVQALTPALIHIAFGFEGSRPSQVNVLKKSFGYDSSNEVHR